jgi:hypothetical protein
MKILHFEVDRMKNIFFICIKGVALCITCNETVLKENSIKKHYETKRAS